METYEEFIQNILNTRGRFNCGDEYHERHHIVPKCLGGNNEEDNLIDLFAREHFIAHKLLAKENPDNYKITYAYTCMAFLKSETHQRYELTPEEYEEARIAFHIAAKERLSDPENCPMFGKKHSDETKAIISIKTKKRFENPENHPMYGKHPSEETREKISESNIGKTAWNNGISCFVGKDNPFYGKHHSEESKEIMRQKKLQWIEENGVPFKGKHHTEETKELLSELAIERFKDPEIRKVYSDAQKKRYENQEERDKLSDINSIPVYQLSNNCDIIAEYKNSIIASEQTGIDRNGIWRCCDFSQITAGGYYWIYKRDYDIGKRPLTNNPKNNQPVPIVQLTLEDKFIREYKSMKEASIINGYDRAAINKCCLHLRESAYGFHWMKKEEYENLINKQKIF